MLVVVLVTVGLWVGTVDASEAGARLSERRVAVLPFTVEGEAELGHLGESMVDLLSIGLHGAGGLESVDANTLLGYVGPGGGGVRDPAQGREVAAHFGADRFVLGSVTKRGPQIRFAASLYDAGGQVQGQAEAVARSEEVLPAMIDTLVVQLMAGLVEGPMQELVPVAAKTTTSFRALKAFLQGEYLARQGRWGTDGEASQAMREAVGHDSTFALAWTRLLYWEGARERKAIAGYITKYRHKLPERERRLADVMLDDSSGFEEVLRQYREVVDTYPDFARARFIYADYLYHRGYYNGHPASEARPHFERALRYDPNNSEILYHMPEVLLKAWAFDAMDTLLVHHRDVLEYTVDYQAQQTALAAGRGDEQRFEALLAERDRDDSSTAQGIGRLSLMLSLFLEDLPAAERVLDLLDRPRPGGGDQQAIAQLLQAEYALAQGRLRRVDSLLAAAFDAHPWHLPLRAVTVASRHYPVSEEQLAALRDRVARWDTARVRIGSWFGGDHFPGEYAEVKAYLTGLLSERLDDEAGLGQATAALQAIAARKGANSFAYAMERILAALSLWRGGQPAEALAALDEVGASPHHRNLIVTGPKMYVYAEILLAEGRYEEALPWYTALLDPGLPFPVGLPYLGPSYLRRAEIYARRGEVEQAIEYYTRLVQLWQGADPELEPYVEQARGQLDHLVEQ